jgi:hypothetical protein
VQSRLLMGLGPPGWPQIGGHPLVRRPGCGWRSRNASRSTYGFEVPEVGQPLTAGLAVLDMPGADLLELPHRPVHRIRRPLTRPPGQRRSAGHPLEGS